MSSWSNVVTGFDGSDETIIFGDRHVALVENSVYETKTLATIERTSEAINTQKPVCRSLFTKNSLGVALDKTFLLFHKIGNSLGINISFEGVINAFLFSPDGKYAFFALDSFELVCVDIQLPGKILFKKEIPNVDGEKGKIVEIIHKNAENMLILLFIYNNGKILKFSCDFDQTSDELKNDQFTVVHNVISQGFSLVVGQSCHYFKENIYDATVFFGFENKISLWSEKNEKMSLALHLDKETKIQCIKSNRFLTMAITTDGHLLQICRDTFFVVREKKDVNIVDFTFIENSVHSISEVLLLTDTEVMLIEPFTFAIKFRLETGISSFLVYGLIDCEDLFYLEGTNNEEGNVETIRLKTITVNQPEMRLERLLARRKFTEAEDFAKHYDLLEHVRKSKVKWILGELHLQLSQNSSFMLFEELMGLVKIIKDDEFVGECCIKATPPDIQKTKNLLQYAWERLSNLPSKNSTIISHLKSLKLLLNAVGSFTLIHGNSGTTEEWINFSTANPIILCQEYLSKGRTKEAMIICKRNILKLISELSIEMALSLLDVLPLEVSAENTLEWLNCFFPIILSSHSQLLNKFIDWIIRKTKYFEHLDQESWPRNALKFSIECSSVIKNIIANNEFNDSFSLNQGISLSNSAINILNEFSLNLNYLCMLKEEYNIHIAYDKYILYQEPQQRLMFLHLLFDYIPKNLISHFIENFVKTVFPGQYKEIDLVISGYIRNMTQNFDSYQNYSWEGKCVVFIDCIKDLSEKLGTIKYILPHVFIPLSTDIENIIESIRHFKHPLVYSLLNNVKDISKKVVLKKYGIPCESIDMDEIEFLGLRILELTPEDSLEEALEDAKSIMNSNYCEALWMTAIQRGFSEKAFLIMKKKLTKSQILSLCDNMVNGVIKPQLALKSSPEAKQNHLQALDDIISYCRCENTTEAKQIVEISLNIKALHKINQNHEKKIELDNNMYGVGKDSVLELTVSHLTDRIPENSNISDDTNEVLNVKKTLWEISRELNIEYERSLLEFVSLCVKEEKHHCAAHFIKFLKYTPYFEKKSNAISKLLEKMLEKLCSMNEKDEVISSILQDISSSLIISCSTSDISKNSIILDISKLFTTPPQKPDWSTNYEDPFEDHQLILTPTLRDSLLNCVRDIPVTIDTFSLNDDLENVLQSIPNDLISFNHIYTIVWLFFKQGLITDPKSFKRISKIALLKASPVLLNMLGSRSFALNLALILLHHFQPEQAIQWLNNVANKISADDLKWNNALGLLGKYYCELHQELSCIVDHDMSNYFHEIYIMTSWGIKISQYGIPAQEACSDAIEDRKKLLIKLIATPGIELDVLQLYCTDMKLDVQKCLLFYLQHILVSWKPIFSITKSSSGKTVLTLENDTKDLLTICQRIVFQTENEESLRNFLLVVWDEVNTYYYEVFKVILQIMPLKYQEKLSPFSSILEFLLMYTRVGEIQKSEMDDWHSLNPSNQNLPEIAKYRLPLNKFPCEAVKLLKSEFTLDTYELWLNAPVWTTNARNQDVICSFTITNLRNDDIPTSSSTWLLHNRKKELLEQIEQCLRYIQSFEIAVAALYFVVNHVMPPGIDQVQAAQLCFIKAEQWATNDPSEKAHTGKARAEKKYLTISTVHILHKYGLGKPDYIALALQPADLISALYHDPCLIEDSLSTKPDINKAVECIAALHDINIASVTLELLPKWLDAENKTEVNNFKLLDHSSTTQYSDNVKRACYLLLGCKELSKVESYLVGIAFTRNHEENRKPVGTRLRALQCLTAITTAEKLQLITARPIEAVKAQMQVLEIVYYLELYGCSYTIKGFEHTSKELIVQYFLKSPSNGKIKLAAHIARCYDLKNPQMWAEIIQKMVAFPMVQELKILLPLIEEIMIEQNVIKKVWSLLIESAMTSEKHEEVLDLIERCPDSSYFDSQVLVEFFSKINHQHALKYLISLNGH